jgi:hypothetical protein
VRASAWAACAAGAAVLFSAAACEYVTGNTDGYTLAAGDSDGGACGEGGCSSSLGTCLSAADCGDGGDVCCLEINSSLTSVSEVCGARPCTNTLGLNVQLCKSNAECGDASACLTQQCDLGSGSMTTIQACGLVTSCTASK